MSYSFLGQLTLWKQRSVITNFGLTLFERAFLMIDISVTWVRSL
ncbi:hypothetical protein LINPERHAP1_LOCUS20532 [Linum perenne]